MRRDVLSQQFVQRFGGEAPQAAVRAPGRVNLIGEHTDYNDGFVLPIAIEREILALARPRPDRTVRLASTAVAEEVVIDLSSPVTRGIPAWGDYPRGVVAGLLERGQPLVGADVLFDSTIPHGAGLSSSAALEVATAKVLLNLAGTPDALDDRELALLCQTAEHRYAGTPCGIMDQSIVIMGRPGHALLLDCRDGRTRQVPFDHPEVVLLVCDTEVKHELNDGGYAARRVQCESAASKLGLASLRDATRDMLARCPSLSDVERRRARHVVGEIERTLQAVDALDGDDLGRFGALMVGSHTSLRDDYEVSCDELDAVVEAALRCEGVYGARMTGGGFGGCAIVLTTASREEPVTRQIQEAFAARFGRSCPVFATRAADGASMA